ncbi:hypothetical protein CAPTEDRAFT_190633 [Capitella teleta]|uniref:G-protein coupled receptors family 1 profile domain-containing protein n=1 Tax=Capitella teleta TaxID=283909 RepID=R7UAF5_CAPTE|nr:hypothetical protein CAPTEDRAFT_190633 [Capitella teleta]|eukprot:ELU00798.1 hypothetical protein CAPTEDRAFT_190633 [Capitella teleta]
MDDLDLECSLRVLLHVDQFYQDATGPDVTTMTVVLSITGFLGILGNSVVVMMCTCCKPSSKSTQHYICMIAICDLLICLVLVPYRISAYHLVIPELCCKIFEGLTYFSESYSLGLLLAVAFDRYLAVGHPVYFSQMKHFPAIWAFITGILVLSVGIPAGLLAGDYVVVFSNKTNTSRQCYTGVCDADGFDYRYFSETGRYIYIIYLAVLYMAAFTSLVTMYSKVFCTVYEKFAMRSIRHPTPAHDQPSCSGASVKSIDVEVIEVEPHTRDAPLEGTEPASLKDTPPMQMVMHRRIAKICCMVTLAYFATWLPFFLMRTGLVPNIVTLRLAFFWSNAINPFIYSFSNRKFRGQVLSLVKCTKYCDSFS